MFARRAASEIAVGDQNPRVAAGRPVENEIRAFATIPVEAQLAEEMAAQARTRQRLHIFGGNDHVRVDIGERQGRRDRFRPNEFLHIASINLAF